MSGARIKRKWKFLFPLLVNDLSHSLVLGRCFMKDLTVTHCKMETAVGAIILISLHIQSWRCGTEREHIFVYSFPTGIKEKKNSKSLGRPRKLPGKRVCSVLVSYSGLSLISLFKGPLAHLLCIHWTDPALLREQHSSNPDSRMVGGKWYFYCFNWSHCQQEPNSRWNMEKTACGLRGKCSNTRKLL